MFCKSCQEVFPFYRLLFSVIPSLLCRCRSMGWRLVVFVCIMTAIRAREIIIDATTGIL